MYIDVDGVIVRLIFRILFMIIFAYLAILGSLCNELAKKHILLQNRNVRVSETSGWLNLSALMKALWKLKHVPSWKWWLLMATIGILSKASDLATTAVQQKYLHSECDFGIGMVLPMSGPGFISVPPNNGRPVLVAGNAQIISEANSCPQGIYKKVNTDASFCANSGDILGTWKCQSVGEDITYQQGHYTYEDITSDLTRKGLLYPYNSWAIRTDTNDEYLFSHLVAWGSSAFDNSNETFSVKASIELAGLNDDDKVMHSMHCTMHAPGANAIARGTASNSTLGLWLSGFQGNMYDGLESPAVTNPEQTLAWYLNTILMVAGGSDYLLSKAPINDSTQGCLVLTTVIPTWFLAIVGFTLLACIFLTALTLYFWVRVRLHKDRARLDNAPLDLWTWMAYGVAESNVGMNGPIAIVRPNELRNWTVTASNGNAVRVAKQQEELQSLTIQR